MLDKSIERIIKALNKTIAAGTLFLLMLLITVDVVGRYIFNNPVRGAHEISQIGLAVVVFIGLSYTTFLKGHIGIDLVVSRLSPRWQAFVDMVNNFFGIVIFSLITWQGLDSALRAKAYGDTSEILKFPIYPFRLLVPLGAILVCLVLIIHIVQSIRIMKQGRS